MECRLRPMKTNESNCITNDSCSHPERGWRRRKLTEVILRNIVSTDTIRQRQEELPSDTVFQLANFFASKGNGLGILKLLHLYRFKKNQYILDNESQVVTFKESHKEGKGRKQNKPRGAGLIGDVNSDSFTKKEKKICVCIYTDKQMQKPIQLCMHA